MPAADSCAWAASTVILTTSAGTRCFMASVLDTDGFGVVLPMAVGEPLDSGPTGPAPVAEAELSDCGPRTVGDSVDTGPAPVAGAVDSGSTESCPQETVEPLINAAV